MLGQAVRLPPQLTSQAHDDAQSIDGQAPAPEQLIEHSPGPQLICWHAPASEHSMLQLLAAAQSMLPQAPGLLQWNVQSKPGGQCRLPQVRPPQLIRQVGSVGSLRSQSVHGAGQLLLPPTQ